METAWPPVSCSASSSSSGSRVLARGWPEGVGVECVCVCVCVWGVSVCVCVCGARTEWEPSTKSQSGTPTILFHRWYSTTSCGPGDAPSLRVRWVCM